MKPDTLSNFIYILTIALCVFAFFSCATKRPEPAYTVRVYTSKEACEKEKQDKFTKARYYSALIDSFIMLRDQGNPSYEDSVQFYIKAARKDIAATDKEWNEFMSEYIAFKFGLDLKKIHHQTK